MSNHQNWCRDLLRREQVIDALCATLPVDPEKLEAVKLWSEWDSEGASDLG